jgi:hypothetical protein
MIRLWMSDPTVPISKSVQAEKGIKFATGFLEVMLGLQRVVLFRMRSLAGAIWQ